MSTPSIKVGQGNWGIKATSLLGYANTDKKFVAREFTVGRLLNTATRVNPSGNIEIVNANVPRIDYFGGQASLLVEPSAQNGILNSLDTRASWTLGIHLTSGAIDVIGVSGNNLTVITSGSNVGAGNGRLARFSNNVVLASGSTYTISFLVKQTDTHTIAGYYGNIVGVGDIGGGFDVSGLFNSGAIYNNANIINRVRRVERFGTDVFRCSETFTMTASGTLTTFALAPIVAVTNGANSAVGTKIGFAAPQIELGSAPTSFIPTTTGAQTRNADVISVTGVAGLIGQTEGTIYAEFINTFSSSYNDGVLIRVFSDANNEVFGRKEAASNRYTFRWRANSQNTTFTSVNVPDGVNKVAIAYKSGDTALFLNGAQIGSTSTDVRAFSVNPTTVALGSNGGAGQFFNDRIRAAALYTTRLTNAELAFITQP